MIGDTHQVDIVRYGRGSARSTEDTVVVEEPLALRVDGKDVVVTMRTPGDDLDLAAGFLLTEGWIRTVEDIGTLAYCPDEDDPDRRNLVEARLVRSYRTSGPDRYSWANSSCGLCGKSTIDGIRQELEVLGTGVSVRAEVVLMLPDRLRLRQRNFSRTGGIHGAGLFDPEGEEIVVREDIGRHNAVDKAIGAALRQGTKGRAAILMVTGRLGFEIAQKALVARIPVVASVSAPSSLALELAEELGLTAVGFVRDGSMNVYTHPDRVKATSNPSLEGKQH